MGHSWGKYLDHFEPSPDVLGADKYTLRLLRELELTLEEVDCLYTAFSDMDSDSSGVIRLDELLAYFNIPRTILTEKIYTDKESKLKTFLNFEQFSMYTWQFLTLSLDKLPAFAFQLIDVKKTGSLPLESVKVLVEIIHYKAREECEVVRKMIKKCDVAFGEKPVTAGDFAGLSDNNRALCDPLRRTQIAFQSKLLGRVNWKRLRLAREAKESHAELDAADMLLTKLRADRRMNSSVVEMGKKNEKLQAKVEEMQDEETFQDEAVSKKQIKLADHDLHDRVVLPPEGNVRVPKSVTQRRSPLLVAGRTDKQTKKGKKKKKRSFGRRTSSLHDKGEASSGKTRRHSMNDGASSPAAAMLKDINNVTIFKSSSLDKYDDEDDEKNPIADTIELSNLPLARKTSGIKEGTVQPL